jgi:hypothetical protein
MGRRSRPANGEHGGPLGRRDSWCATDEWSRGVVGDLGRSPARWGRCERLVTSKWAAVLCRLADNGPVDWVAQVWLVKQKRILDKFIYLIPMNTE